MASTRSDSDDDWQVPTKAAVTLTLEELDLDAAASQKRWDNSYKTREISEAAQAAFVLSSKSSRAGTGSLFDDDDTAFADEAAHELKKDVVGRVGSLGARRDYEPAVEAEDDAALVYEHVDAALLEAAHVDFLDDTNEAHNSVPSTSASTSAVNTSSAPTTAQQIPSAASEQKRSSANMAPACSAGEGGIVETRGSASRQAGGGLREKGLASSLFADVAEDDGGDWFLKKK